MANPSLHEQYDRTEERQLSDRSAALGAACGLTLLACVPLLRGGRVRWWALALAALVFLISLLRPRLFHPAAWLGRKLADILGRVLGLIALALLFYLVIAPFGLVRRIFVRDPLHRRIDRNCKTYWVPRQSPQPTLESMAHQF